MLPPSHRSVHLRHLLALASMVALAACLSPTLPLPPPEEPGTILESGDEEWTLVGDCVEGAEVVGYNEETGRGSVFIDQDNTGTYSLVVEGAVCDVVLIRQVRGDDASGETRVVLRETANGVPVDPNACQ